MSAELVGRRWVRGDGVASEVTIEGDWWGPYGIQRESIARSTRLLEALGDCK